jgi:hypothetical protein
MNMWYVILTMVSIQIIAVFIIDLSGILDQTERLTGKKIPKPFSCSLCMTWWANLIYLIAVDYFSLPMIAFAAILAFFAPATGGWMVFVKDFLAGIQNKIIRKLFKQDSI